MPETYPYLRLKLAQSLFHKPLERLEADERRRLDDVAAQQMTIEQRILATPEAAQVALPESSLNQAVAEIRGRYPSEAEFRADLARSGLDPLSLARAIKRDLQFEAVLERVASAAVTISETDIEIFYLMHRERFRRPENRTLSHILVTINEALPGSDRVSARRKIEGIRERLLLAPQRFAEQALKYSECPTATNGGLLGTLIRGQLFPELEPVAFSLPLGELSEIVESPLGFHLLHCAAIEDASVLSLDSVREKIRGHLFDSRRRSAQKAWIASLFRPARSEEAGVSPLRRAAG